ncbi:MFS transporter [Candidatus Gottesmanbacteria bacterium]|nr:MFS transporter [Candidatus Gottesmanbacteria bacterium]
MNFIKSPKFLIFLIVVVNFLGYGIVFPILPLLTEQYGGDPIISGFLIAIFSLMQVISMPILGRLSDRYGRKPMLLFSLWGTVFSFALMGLTHSIFWLMVARIIDGISGGNLSIAQAYIADVTDKKGRAGGMGVLAAGISVGFIFGPLWGGFFSKISLAAPFIAATILTVISVLLTQFFLPESVSKQEFSYEKKHFSFAAFWRHITEPVMLILYATNLFLFWAQSGVFTTMSLFAKDVLGMTVAGVSLLFAFGGILSALIQGFAIGKVVARVSEEKIFIVSAIIGVVGFAIMARGSNWILFTLGITIFSIGNSFLMPVITSLVSEKSSEHEQGGNMGLLQSFGSVGRIFGPIAAGFLYETISPFTPSVMGAVIMVIILGFGVKLFVSSSKS